ncbi:snake venom 5'-nucleotidase [Lepeophtheirus salmonis]|uniref:snake venom 5'-nucleotidase n=1 Tax=Lepeophtheirus salmonis TaxID=72036 RepID=UPI001AE4E3D6|nr:snake venom 5'-nucleotidase-like [Lepeophtheirus salmonis]
MNTLNVLLTGSNNLLILSCLFGLCSSLSVSRSSSENETSNVSFDILHVNDIHAHFDQLNAINSRCRTESEKCYGGFPRLFESVKSLRDSLNKSLLLNAGDYYEGTMWYTIFKYEPVIEFSNLLNYTAASIGNHEFDDGLEGLKPFIEGANFPILACNIRYKGLESLQFKKSIVDISLGVKIGIIGYVTTETAYSTNSSIPKLLEFLDEVPAIREEAKKLIKEGVKIIIALGHSGYEKDLEIAKKVEEVDLVVGGHSHSFLYPKGETPPLNDHIVGDYPTYVSQSSGKVVPVVQAYCYSKYLGQLKVNFDGNGELLKPVKGSGISKAVVQLLDGKEDPYIENVMKPYKDKLAQYYKTIGSTNVVLARGRMKESNLGDLVADSMVHALKKPDAIAFINDDGIRSIIDKGSITGEDVLSVAPFGNTLDLITINGSSIRTVLENVASKWGNGTYATFLEISSGLKLVYSIKDDNVGQRIVSAKHKCSATNWCDLVDKNDYQIVLPNFLSEGGLESPNFADLMKSKVKGNITDYAALQAYINATSPINQGIEGRITFLENSASSLAFALPLILSTLFSHFL